MPFIPDPLEPRYAHIADGDPTPEELGLEFSDPMFHVMNQFEPCDCKSNNPDCPDCGGTGIRRHLTETNIEALRSLHPDRLRALQDALEGINGILEQLHGHDEGHIHGPQCSHDTLHEEDHQPFGYRGQGFTVEMQKQMRDLSERPTMSQEEVDSHYKGNPAWLDRSKLGAVEGKCGTCGDEATGRDWDGIPACHKHEAPSTVVMQAGDSVFPQNPAHYNMERSRAVFEGLPMPEPISSDVNIESLPDDEPVTVPVDCRRCHTIYGIPMKGHQLKRLVRQDGLMENILPHLPAGDRELFISGVCDPCFNNMFPPEEDDE